MDRRLPGKTSCPRLFSSFFNKLFFFHSILMVFSEYIHWIVVYIPLFGHLYCTQAVFKTIFSFKPFVQQGLVIIFFMRPSGQRSSLSFSLFCSAKEWIGFDLKHFTKKFLTIWNHPFSCLSQKENLVTRLQGEFE